MFKSELADVRKVLGGIQEEVSSAFHFESCRAEAQGELIDELHKALGACRRNNEALALQSPNSRGQKSTRLQESSSPSERKHAAFELAGRQSPHQDLSGISELYDNFSESQCMGEALLHQASTDLHCKNEAWEAQIAVSGRYHAPQERVYSVLPCYKSQVDELQAMVVTLRKENSMLQFQNHLDKLLRESGRPPQERELAELQEALSDLRRENRRLTLENANLETLHHESRRLALHNAGFEALQHENRRLQLQVQELADIRALLEMLLQEHEAALCELVDLRRALSLVQIDGVCTASAHMQIESIVSEGKLLDAQAQQHSEFGQAMDELNHKSRTLEPMKQEVTRVCEALRTLRWEHERLKLQDPSPARDPEDLINGSDGHSAC